VAPEDRVSQPAYITKRRTLGVCAMIEGRSHPVNTTKRIVLTDAYLCISLGEVHTDDYCYKLVATIIGNSPL
jgi:hypothetical protein